MKVAVITQGSSSAVNALKDSAHETHEVQLGEDFVLRLKALDPDAVFVGLNKGLAADGSVQSLLSMLGYPFVGTSAGVCRAACNRAVLSGVMAGFYAGYDGCASCVPGVTLSSELFRNIDVEPIVEDLVAALPSGYPLAVRSVVAGSSFRAERVDDAVQLASVLKSAFETTDEVLVQEWVEGVHLGVTVLSEGDDSYVLPPVLLEGMQAPVPLEELSHDEALAQAIRSEVERAAMETHQALGCRDLSVVDIMWDGARARVLGIDTCPDVSEGHVFVAACKAVGLSSSAVLDELIEISCER